MDKQTMGAVLLGVGALVFGAASVGGHGTVAFWAFLVAGAGWMGIAEEKAEDSERA